ncbi:MAG: ABC transporter permease, partial [Lachnospiraceae bacterium]|nr:ABC transporter permease [Lachnospiraceae bacterium]
MTLSKLSLRNAKRQAADYLVYFITIIMAAALLYAFNGLIFSKEVRELSSLFENLTFLIILASIVMVCIFGWLVSYATNFMLTRRSRELGLYILIGLENGQVARLFFIENLAVGGAALGIGLLFG